MIITQTTDFTRRRGKTDEWERKRTGGKPKKKKQEGRRAATGRSVRSTLVVWVGRLGVWAAEEMFFVDFVGSL
jgi:hypothetical protein